MNMTVDSAELAVAAVANDDLDLVHAAKNGDVAAFEQLVSRYDRKLLRIAQSITHNREDSQDAVQEAFLKAYQNLSGFREDSKFSTWLFRITVNQSLMKLRKQRSTKEMSLDEDFEAEGDFLPKEVADWAPNPEQRYWASELRDILIRTLLSIVGIRRARLQLREGLNKYFSKQTHLARAQLFPSGRPTGRILGLFAECLRNAMERTHSINVAESEMHAAIRTPTTENVDRCLNHV